MRKWREFTPANKIFSDADIDYLVAHYPTDGPAVVAVALGKSHAQVMGKANALGVKMTGPTRKRVVGSQNVERMTNDNPMKRPDVRKRVSAWMKNTPRGQAVYALMMVGQQQLQRDRPSGLERRLAAMLTDMGIAFESAYFIKPNFIVDFRIGSLIIEADGDWWHGHPRFEPLRPQQIAQRKRDAARNAYLTKCGYTVVRIWESALTYELLERVLIEHHAAASED